MYFGKTIKTPNPKFCPSKLDGLRISMDSAPPTDFWLSVWSMGSWSFGQFRLNWFRALTPKSETTEHKLRVAELSAAINYRGLLHLPMFHSVMLFYELCCRNLKKLPMNILPWHFSIMFHFSVLWQSKGN